MVSSNARLLPAYAAVLVSNRDHGQFRFSDRTPLTAGAIVECAWGIEITAANKSVPILRGLIQSVPLIFTNAVATTMVGIKVWYYYRDVKGSLGLFTRKSQVERVLVLLLESGLLYCIIWVPVHILYILIAGASDALAKGHATVGRRTISQSARPTDARCKSYIDSQMTIDAGERFRPLSADDVYAFQIIVIEIGVDLVLYGVQAAVFVAAMVILARRQSPSRFTLAAILCLFISSTVAVAANTTFYVMQIPSEVGTSVDNVRGILARLDILIANINNRLQYALSDAVLVWRAWCLWRDSLIAKCILSVCMCGTVFGSIAECAWTYWPDSTPTGESVKIAKFLTLLIPLLVTNIVATMFIGIRVWYYRREVKGSLGLFGRKSQVEKVLMLLLESGFIYCLIWIANGVLKGIAGASGFSIISALGTAYHNVAGIYPTCVCFVALQGSTAQSLVSAQISQAMHFASSHEPSERGAHEDVAISGEQLSRVSGSDHGSYLRGSRIAEVART
ncbi:hypothetical protein HDZ31DRAFT_33618 [Schizophyllum fasciatum]